MTGATVLYFCDFGANFTRPHLLNKVNGLSEEIWTRRHPYLLTYLLTRHRILYI